MAGDVWILTSQQDFLKGTLSDIVATPEGTLQLSPNGTALAHRGIVLANGPPGSFDSEWARDPSVLVDVNGTYWMWYRGSDGSRWRILYATSADGLVWTKQGVAIDNSSTVGAPFVLFENSTFHMWFQDGGAINHATSQDGRTWSVDGLALPPGTAGGWDSFAVGTPWVVRTPTRYLLYYLGSDGYADYIGVAGSTNYTGFTALSSTPVVGLGPAAWDGAKVRFPAVFPGSPWTMYYAGFDNSIWRIGLATSDDGLNWTKAPDNPIFSPAPDPSWDYQGVVGGFPFRDSSGLRFYYTGSDGSTAQIGLAEEAQAYPASGTYESPVFDSGAPLTSWQSIMVNATIPPGAEVVASVRSGDTPVPDATWSAWQTSDPGTGQVNLPRSRYLLYRLNFSRLDPTETPIVSDVTVRYGPNRGPDAMDLLPATGTWAGAAPTVSWMAHDPENDPQVAFEVQLSRSQSFAIVENTSGIVTSSNMQWQPPSLGEGLWYWRVHLSDGGAWGPWSLSQFRVDTTPPVLTVTTPISSAVVGSSRVSVTWTASDSLSGLDRVEIRLDAGAPIVLPASSSSYTFFQVADGDHGIVVTAYDQVGHATAVQVLVTVDTVDPTITITSPSSGSTETSNRVLVTWEADGTGTPIDRFQLVVDGGVPIVVGAAERSYVLVANGDGDHVVTVTAFDQAGNSATRVVRIHVDTNILSLSGPYGPWPSASIVIAVTLIAAFLVLRVMRHRRRGNPPPPR